MRRKSLIATAWLAAVLLSACGGGTPAPATLAPATGAPAVASPAAPTASPTAAPLPTAAAVQPVVGMPAGTGGAPWWNDSVFYEIFVRSFYDSSGDGIGDFNGITARLDYLQGLGVTGIWLMPIHPSPSYHGYDVTDYFSTNPDYGSLDDFRRLLAEAHKRNIRVIIDLVLNHTSNKHPWFVAAQDPASPFHDWYVWSDKDMSGDAVWHKAANGQYYYGNFGANMPDLNYKNPDVTAKMQSVVQYWLKDVGVDGFRLDAAQHLLEEGTLRKNTPSTHEWFKGFRTFYKGVNPQAMTVGEVWSGTYDVAEYTQGDQLDLAFDFDLAQAWVSAARLGKAADAIKTLAYDDRLFKPEQYATFLTNHDQARGMSLYRNDPAKGKVAATMLLTAPGVPFIYYGEEIGMIGNKPDEQIRTPMQWSADPNGGFTSGTPWELPFSDFARKNVAAESADPDSLLSHYKVLLALRNAHVALRLGDTTALKSTSDAVYALLRTSKAENVLVVVNLGAQPLKDYALSLDKGPLSGAYRLLPMLVPPGSGALAGLTASAKGGFDAYQPLPELAPFASLVVQLQPAR